MLLTLPIAEVIHATPRARIVRIALDGHPFAYAPGQAVLVGSHGQPKRRPYSMGTPPEDAAREGFLELLVGVDDEGMPGTHLRLDPGQLVDVEGPVGSFIFPPDPPERRFVFIAGGTGIAPLRAMLRRALALPHREIGLFYSVRSPDEFAYGDELRALANDGAIELRQTVTRSTDAVWIGARGRIGRAALGELVHTPETLCFICGPPALVEEIPKLLAGLGVARDRIRIEEW